MLEFAIKLNTVARLTDLSTDNRSNLEEFKARFHDKAMIMWNHPYFRRSGKRENITVTDEELENKVEALAEDYKKPVEDFKKTLKPEDKDGIKNLILTQKVLGFLIKNSNIIEKKKEDITELEEVDTDDNDEETL